MSHPPPQGPPGGHPPQHSYPPPPGGPPPPQQQYPGQQPGQHQYAPPPPPGHPLHSPPPPGGGHHMQSPPPPGGGHHMQSPPPPQQQPIQHHQNQQMNQPLANPSESGSFPGGTYTVAHRDTNAVLNVTLQQGANVRSKSGAMIHMSGSVQLAGKVKFSMKKLFTGSDMSESTYTGPGRVALGPTLFGDIITLQINGQQNWIIGKDAMLACTSEIVRENKTQGISKSLFSGEDLFVYRVMGQGIVWLTSFGAVDRLDLKPGEEHIVDNGHLVAWSCEYKIEKAGGGAMSGMKTGEGLVCRFTGPGSVYVQTRNQDEFESYIRAHSASN